MKGIRKIQIEPTTKCNYRCKICTRVCHGVPENYIDFDLYIKIINNFEFVETIHLQGLGEPLLHPDILDLISRANNKARYVTTVTNGSLLTEGVGVELFSSGLSHLAISFDSLEQNVLSKIKNGANVEQLKKNIKDTISSCLQNGVSDSCFTIIFVATKDTVKGLSSLVKFVSSVGGKRIFVLNLFTVDCDAELNEFRVEPKDMVFINKAINVAKEVSVDLFIPDFFNVNKKFKCRLPYHSIYIDCRGYVTPCCMLSNSEDINFGNIKNNNIQDIYNSSAALKFRENLMTGMNDRCNMCPVAEGRMWHSRFYE